MKRCLLVRRNRSSREENKRFFIDTPYTAHIKWYGFEVDNTVEGTGPRRQAPGVVYQCDSLTCQDMVSRHFEICFAFSNLTIPTFFPLSPSYHPIKSGWNTPGLSLPTGWISTAHKFVLAPWWFGSKRRFSHPCSSTVDRLLFWNKSLLEKWTTNPNKEGGSDSCVHCRTHRCLVDFSSMLPIRRKSGIRASFDANSQWVSLES